VSAGRVGPATPFWQVPAPAPFAGSYAGAQQRLDELLTRAVERRLIADVPLGAFLSGGVDSSIIVALMRRLGVSPLRTFSIGFPDARYDETAHARAVARHCDTEHHEYRVTPAAAEVLPLLAYHYDEPFADSSAIPTYYVARETRRHVTVALTGDGGDECFAGYDRYRAAELAARGDVLPAPLRRALARVAEFLPHGQPKSVTRRLYRFLAALGDDAVGRYLAWVGVFPPALLAAGYSPEFRARLEFDEPQEWFAGLYAGNPPRAGAQARVADGLSAPACAAFADLQSYLPYDLLTKVDIASMACSLECRAPFLDHELVEFALSLPIGWRLGKRIVKDWARPLLPPGIVDRPKMGFGVPVGEWFRGELRGLLHERVLAPDGLCGRIFCRSWLERLLGEHDSGRDDHTHRLWALLMLELWHERWQGTL
jgi:asparagine synthase (glutamine-hydrolysing)